MRFIMEIFTSFSPKIEFLPSLFSLIAICKMKLEKHGSKLPVKSILSRTKTSYTYLLITNDKCKRGYLIHGAVCVM